MARGELPSLPQEMMVEILSRLPAKTVGQFRCVSKPWSVLLSDPLFIKTHLNNRRTQENLILIFPFPNNVTIHTIADVGDDNLSRTIRFQPELPEISMRVSGSCNGLVLLFNGSLYVVNPTTLRQVQIQNLPGEILDYGLGYDACSDDYKIVAIMDGHSEEELKSSTYSFAYMYSMKKGIWKRLERSSDYRNSVPYDEIGWQPGAFISGALHWWADSRGGSCLITTFDLVDETFKEIPGPDSLNGAKKFHDVLVLKGCLCVLDTDNTETGLDRVDFWIMEEYGVKESWVKLSVTFEPDWSVVKPLCFIADDKIVLEIDEFDLIVYEFKTRTLTDFMVDGVPATFDNIGTFVVSLVWPS